MLIAAIAALVWWKSNPDDPWLGQLVMIGSVLLIVTPHYPWYALLLIPMIAMSGRWEWMLVPLAITERLLFPSLDDVWMARIAVGLAIAMIIAVTIWRRADPRNDAGSPPQRSQNGNGADQFQSSWWRAANPEHHLPGPGPPPTHKG